MKQYVIISVLLILIISCGRQHERPIRQESCVVSIIEDVTDPHILSPIPAPILSLYDFTENKNKEAWFRLQHITDRQLGPVKEFHLASGEITNAENALNEPWHRERLIQAFYDSVARAIINNNKYVKTGMKYSECCKKIASELGYLSHSTASQKMLLVFSDLKENEAAFSSYNKEDMVQLRLHPDSVAAMLFRLHPIPETLSDINVFLIYRAKNRDDEVGFLLHTKLYKELESRGAKVIVQADNDKF